MQPPTVLSTTPLHGSHLLYTNLDPEYTAARNEFHSVSAEYQRSIEHIRHTEFTRVRDVAYLDCGGAALYSETQVQAAINQLQDVLFCNPHSQNGPGSASAEAEALLRLRTLQMCNASGQEYDVILTSGATASLKLVAECFPWSAASSFEYTRSNHNSVLGIRAVALERGATVQAIEVEPACPTGGQDKPHQSKAAFSIKPCGAAMINRNRCDSHQYKHASKNSQQGTMSNFVQVPSALKVQPTAAHSTSVHPAPETSDAVALHHDHLHQQEDAPPHSLYHLFAYPPECNFSGVRTHGSIVQQVHQCCSYTTALPFPTAQRGSSKLSKATDTCTCGAHPEGGDMHSSCSSIQSSPDQASSHGQHVPQRSARPGSQPCVVGSVEQQTGRWLVLMDAAKACTTQPPDLSQHPADFVTVSYYKIFGYPTGLGALLVRKNVLPLLHKTYFGGGTLSMVLAAQDSIIRRPGHSGFEDGTLPYTSISAALHGFAFIDRLGGWPTISAHATSLADHLASQLRQMQHSNGSPVCVVYGRPSHTRTMGSTHTAPPHSTFCDYDIAVLNQPNCSASIFVKDSILCKQNGPTVAFNLLDDQGGAVGHAEVARLAGLHGIILRAGCFCNPGACEKYLGLQPEDVVAQHAAGHVCWDDVDLIEGRPTGALRASLGHVSTFNEVYALLKLLSRYFVSDHDLTPATLRPAHTTHSSKVQITSSSAYAASPHPSQHQKPHSAASGAAAYLDIITANPASCAGTVSISSPSSSHLSRNNSFSTGSSNNQIDSNTSTLSAMSDVNNDSPASGVHSQGDDNHDSLQWDVTHSIVPRTAATANNVTDINAPSQHQFSQQAADTDPAGVLDHQTLHPQILDEYLDEGFVSCEEDLYSDSECIDPALIGDHAHAFQIHHQIHCMGQGLEGLTTVSVGGSRTDSQIVPFGDLQACPSDSPEVRTQCSPGTSSGGTLTHIYLYPIKSCAPQQAEAWPVGPNGLLFDREWALVDDSSKVVTQKACPRMATLEPHIDITSATLTITSKGSPGLSPLVVTLDGKIVSATKSTLLHKGSHDQRTTLNAGLTRERITVCGETVCGTLVIDSVEADGDAARSWFTHALGIPCRLVRQQDRARLVKRPTGSISANSNTSGNSSGRIDASHLDITPPSVSDAHPPGPAPSVGFANDGQYLLVNEASLLDLNTRMAGGHGIYNRSGGGVPEGGQVPILGVARRGAIAPQVDISRFRPNLVVSGFAPYEEDGWSSVSVGALHCSVLGTCPRCEMLQVDQSAGVRVKADVLVALAQYRRRGGKVHFGVLLAADCARQQQQSGFPEQSHDGMATSVCGNQRLRNVLEGQDIVLEENVTCNLSPQSDAHLSQQSVQGTHRKSRDLAGVTFVCIGDAVKPCK